MLKKTLKKLKCLKKIFEKIGKNQKKSEKNWKKLSEIIRKLINNTCIYVYMTYWQYLIKVGKRKKEDRRYKEDRKVL